MESGIVVMKKKTKSQSTVTSKKTGKAEAESAVKTVLRSDCFRIMNEDGSVDLKADPKLDKTLLLDI